MKRHHKPPLPSIHTPITIVVGTEYQIIPNISIHKNNDLHRIHGRLKKTNMIALPGAQIALHAA
ncbi:hypothetical protein KDK_13850 [Dictyobacter kobayashii]|uniref:Uncharacterized protein n=1 Tax=Dictyobacter kobayashii TaxID=2014872 RepID=A0A402AER5_9CHLR|nr:hypothetical protein KDK_13850 [Dictyobacter kobayashii]